MYIERFTYSPAMGKGRELRALVQERMNKAQAQGRDVSVSIPVFGDDVGSVVVTLRFNDLVEFEKRRAENRADKDVQEFVGKVTSLSASRKVELLEVLIPFSNK